MNKIRANPTRLALFFGSKGNFELILGRHFELGPVTSVRLLAELILGGKTYDVPFCASKDWHLRHMLA